MFIGELSLDGAFASGRGRFERGASRPKKRFQRNIRSGGKRGRGPDSRKHQGFWREKSGRNNRAPGRNRAHRSANKDRDDSRIFGVFVKLSEVRGQAAAKRALIIIAAGGHNLLFSGPPGTGKTMLAQAMNSIIPPPSLEETIEITEIWSAAGLLNRASPVIDFRPFRARDHNASLISIIGGGSIPKPGEISLAHRGVLFLDEMPEFHRDALESLRQPLESGSVSIARSKNRWFFRPDSSLFLR